MKRAGDYAQMVFNGQLVWFLTSLDFHSNVETAKKISLTSQVRPFTYDPTMHSEDSFHIWAQFAIEFKVIF